MSVQRKRGSFSVARALASNPMEAYKSLPALFAKQVQTTPHAIALEDETTTYTYAELEKEVIALSRRLLEYDVGRDKLVGVLLPRGSNFVLACLAALHAGGAFLILELAYPADLLADVLEDSNPVAVITCKSEVGKINKSIPLLVLDEEQRLTNGHGQVQTQQATTTNGNTSHVQANGANGELEYLPKADITNTKASEEKAGKDDTARRPSVGLKRINTNDNTEPLADEDDLERLAFVAYSSGTTGRPKGIANPHRAAVLSYLWRFEVSDLKEGDRVACNVFFIWEMLRPLLRGATVIAVPDETSYDPTALVELLASKRASETLMTPTLLAAVLSRHAEVGARLPHLRTLWLNGEVLTTDLAKRALKAMPNVNLLNVYSACETHEIACGPVRNMLDDTAQYCPVGPPLDPKHIYILDEAGQRVETGVVGELYVGGDLLARGYLNRPETTARVFTTDPYDRTTGAHMYRTGDQARLLSSGLLEITGRVGDMIKIRGYSVVPGKVENAIVAHTAVSHCAVVSYGDGIDRQLVAYIVKDADISAERPGLEIDDSSHSPTARRSLSQHLAHYMIPALWVEMDVLPTNEVSGKVNLKALPPPTGPGSRTPVPKRKADREPIGEDDIAETWASTLNISRNSISPEHTFFDLGGHSLTLADLASRFSRTFGLRIPVARLAAPATINGHLETVRAIRDGDTAAVQADLPAVLRADATLEEGIKGKGVGICPVNEAKTVFLTGATGFLGAFLLNDLLENTAAHVICLVRFKEPSEEDVPAGIARLRSHLLDLGLWNDTMMERVEVLPGNISQRRLGLSPDAFEKLAKRVQVIFHSAASVNLVYPYAALRTANVEGTREIIRLASIGESTLQFVSTNGVLPPSPGEEGWWENAILGVDEVPDKLLDGYGQSKWVAEQLVLEAGRRGIPVKVHRAGTISGHSRTGAGNPWDLLTAIMVESIHLGYYPDVDRWRAEMTPVDFVSKAIIHLSNETKARQSIFHLGDPEPVDTKKVFQDLEKLGYPTQPLSWDEWVDLWNEQRGGVKGGHGAFTVDILRSGMPSVEFLKGITVLHNIATRPFRAVVERPKVDPVLLETYARHWFARGWLPQPPSTQLSLGGSAQSPRRGPLSGKVAVIVGASSGIGAAVASALAKEGCHLALAARRTNALEGVKRRLTVREGKVILRQTDVTVRSDVEALWRAANEELGPVDILVSCAGVMYFTMMSNVQTEEWERTVDVNCKGLLNCLSSTIPSMLSRGKGHIVAISSDAGRKVFPGLGVYSASKSFVEATLQSLRLETAGTGIRITSVQPGNTATDLLTMSTDTEAIKKYGEPTGAKLLNADDVAASIVYALKQPEHVAVNEVLIEPREEPI